MKKIKKILFDIDYWLFMHSPIYIGYDILFILTEWWAAHKVFKLPMIKIQSVPYISESRTVCFHDDEYEIKSKFKLFDITTYKLGWKWKYNEVRFEDNPKIEITLLNKWQYIISLHSPAYNRRGQCDDNMYWETMLEYLYMYKKDFIKTYNNFGWTDCNFIEYEGEKYDVSVSSWNWNCFTKYAINKYLDNCKSKETTIYKFRIT